MKATALSDLPVHTGGRRVIALHPIDPEITFAARRTFGIHQRQCVEMSAIFRPELNKRDRFEIDVRLTGFGDGTGSNFPGSKFQTGKSYVAKLPKRLRLWRDDRFDHFHSAADELEWSRTERQLDPTDRTE